MKSIRDLLLLLTLANYLTAQCSLGCLACEKSSNLTFKCVVCDLHSSYALNGAGQCEKREIENCEIPSADHTKSFCLECKKDYYLDQDLKKCVLIPEVSKVPKCIKYSALNHCSMCEDGNFIQNGLCVSVPTAIEGCILYNNDGTQCLGCGGLRVLKENKCESFDKIDNCLNYSEIACDQCSTGYFKELNYHSTLSLDAPIVHSLVLNDKNSEGIVVPPPKTICHKQSIEKCVKYLNFKECEQCETGYYVNKDRTCSLNPYNRIPNCKRYSDNVTCAECEVSHFLASNECETRTMVDNCAKYDRFSSTCVECNASHFLSGNNCQPRAFSRRIEQCSQNNLQADECLTCKTRFKLTDDKQGCLLAIENCQVYESNSRFSMTSLLCNTCAPGYYPSNNKTECAQQDVINCKEYKVNEPTCSTCDPGFYYKSADNTCLPYTKLACATFETDSDACSKCIKDHYITGGECKPYSVSNCKTLNENSDVCDECEENYYKDGNDCFKRNLIGCSKAIDGKNECETCISGYYKKDNLCWKNNLPNCVHASLSANECLECEKGYYIDANKYCRPLSIPNCLIFKSNLNECESGKCKEGYINSGIYCIKPHVPNCEKLNTNSNTCASDGCKDGYMNDNGYCRKQNIPYCKNYEANKNECSQCEVGYYKDSNKKCRPQVMKGCIEFQDTTSLNCNKCAEGYYKDSNKCMPYTITNCEKPSSSADTCSKCLTNFVVNKTTGNCMIAELPFCKTLNTTSDPIECTECHIGYMLLDNQCVVASSVANCIEADVEPDKCKLCADGYYLDTGDKFCKPQNTLHSQNCLAFKPNSQDCVECKNGYYGTTCTENTNRNNCLISDGVTDACQMCKRGFKNIASNCPAIDAANDKFVDDNCLGNITTDDKTCSACKQGFDLVSSFTENIFSIPNCLVLNSSTTGCDQCAENYQLNSNLKCEAGTTPILCLQKKPADQSALSNKENCLKCDNTTKYLDDTTPTNKKCEDRTVKYDDCEEYVENSNSDASTYCNRCKEGLAMVKPINYAYCVKKWNPESDTPMATLADCTVRSLESFWDADATNNKCVLCADTKLMKTDRTACEAKDAANKLYKKGVNDELLFSALESAVTAVDNATEASLRQVSRKTNFLMYTDCDTGYVRDIALGVLTSTDAATGSFSLSGSVKMLRTNENFWNGKLSPWAHSPSIIGCREIASLEKIPKVTDAVDSTSKVLAYQKAMFYNCENITTLTDEDNSEHQGETCLKCKQGFNGYLVKPEFDKDGNALQRGPVIGVDCTERTSLFEKKYEGLSSLATDTHKFILDDMLQYDSCANGGTLVVFMEILSNQYFWSPSFHTDVQKQNSMMCVDSVPIEKQVSNCHIYILKANEDPNTSVDASYKCIACKPGFKATIASEAVTACEMIPNCDVSDPAKNTWLNNCETCRTGSAWAIEDTNKYPVYSECVTTTISNCQLLDDNSTDSSKKCLVCHDGYNLTADAECVKVDHSKSNCKTPGREANGYMHQLSEAGITFLKTDGNEKHFMATAAFLWWKYENRFTGQAFGCQECKTDYTLVSQITSNPIKACISQWNVFIKPVANCKIYMGDYSVAAKAAGKCRECNAGYRINHDFTACIENSGTFNACMAEDNTSPNPKCTKCEDGYIRYDTGAIPKCLKVEECIEWDTSTFNTASPKCSVCKSGYRPKSATSSECELIPLSDPCIEYSKFQKCIKCRNGGHPVHYTKDPYPGLKIVCTEKIHSESFFANSSFKFENAGLSLMDTSSVVKGLFKLGTTATGFFTADDQQHLCLPQVNVRNCIRYTGITCSECREGFMLGDPFNCVKGTISNCLKYGSNKRCGKCEPGFVVNDSDGSCQARQGQNCLVYDNVIDQCSRCMDGYYLDNSNTKRCLARTNLMCKGYAENKDVCHECHEGYYLMIEANGSAASTGKCIKKDHPGCLYTLAESNDCRICDDGFYLKNDGTCQKYTFTGCDIWSPVEDKCILCHDEFYMENSTNHCKLRINLNCLQFRYYHDECISCQNNFYKKDDKCFEYSVTGCSIYNPYRDTCEACVDGLYLDSNGHCVISNDPNCELMSDYLNGCLKCLDTSYLDKSTGKCKNYTVTCDNYNPYSDECFSCPENSYWSDGKCLAYTVKNCLIHSLFEDRCLSCSPGYYNNSDKCSPIVIENCDLPNHRDASCVICSDGYFNVQGRCQVYTLLNCQMKNPIKNQCYRCNTGYYLDNNGLCQAYTKSGCYGYLPNSDRCSSCLGEFYMHDGECKQYTKTNCILRDDFADACLSCDDDHYLSGDMCVKYTQTNCLLKDNNSDRCLSCIDNHYLEGFSCKPYTIKNCKTKSKKADLCLECEGNRMFRNGLGICQQSTLVQNCGTYNKYFNRCDMCEEGYFLENKACTANPTGVPKCKEYSDESICYRCESPYYLKDNICLISSVIIDQCEFYSHEAICARCATGYILIANECKKHINLTCLEWSTPENCSKCAPGKMINQSGSNVVCDDIGIPECMEAVYNPEGNHTCTKCNNTFYLEENSCKAGTAVPNCMQYSTAELCSKCNDNHILSLNRKSCTEIRDTAGTNCAIGQFNEKPTCSVCKPGFYFNSEGQCVQCQVTGCATCDVINNRKCKLCMPGYQMTELFYCETINAIEGGSLGEDRFKVTQEDLDNQENRSLISSFPGIGLLGIVLLYLMRM